MQVIIMAGGEGSRLRPLTCDRPKPMVPLVNKPVMEHTVDLLKSYNWTDIGVTLQYLPQEIMSYFGDGSRFGVRMQYFIEESPLGTAGSVKNAQDFINETFLVISGDALTNFDLQKAVEFHKQKKSWATLVLKQVNIPLEYGVVITGNDNGITRFLEKPGWGEVFSDTVNTGIYILEPQVLDYIPDNTKFDFSKDLFPLLMKEGKPMYGYRCDGYWCDIGSLEQYQEAHFDILNGKAEVKKLKEEQRGEKIWLGSNVAISKEAKITGPVILGDNTVIEKGAEVGPYSVIGPNCRISEYASIKKSVLWDGVSVGAKAEVKGAVLCSQVKMGQQSSAFEGAVIGDRAAIERMARIRPKVKIWPDKNIERETILKDNLVWGNFGTKNVFGLEGIAGDTNVDILPEYATRVGAAFGATMGAKSDILISSDGTKSGLMVKLALISGLISAGNNVIDIGKVPLPVHRFGIGLVGAKAGLHVHFADNNKAQIVIRMSDSRGVQISRGIERKLESYLQREDFPRASINQIGSVQYAPGIADKYMKSVLSLVNKDNINSRKPKVSAFYQGFINDILNPLMKEIGCEVIAHPVEDKNENLMEQLKRRVIEEKADLGIIIGNSGEGLQIVDEKGRTFNKDDYLTFTAAMLLKGNKEATVAVPVNLPGLVEKVAQEMNGQVIRTKSAPRHFYEELLREDIVNTQRIPQYLLAFDGIAGLLGILDYLANNDVQFSTFIDSLPKVYNSKKSVSCSWENKGKVMRNLIEEYADDDVELIDGIKVLKDDGWALILPDVEDPIYHVFAEGSNYEMAESLADFYVDKIGQVIRNNEV